MLLIQMIVLICFARFAWLYSRGARDLGPQQVSGYYLMTLYTFVDHKLGSLVSQRQESFLRADVAKAIKMMSPFLKNMQHLESNETLHAHVHSRQMVVGGSCRAKGSFTHSKPLVNTSFNCDKFCPLTWEGDISSQISLGSLLEQ